MGELFEEDRITEKDLINLFIKFIKQEKLRMFSLKVDIPYEKDYPDYVYYEDSDTTITIEKKG